MNHTDKSPCDNCGLCCQKLIVEIDEIDVDREPKLREATTLLDGKGAIKFDSRFERQYSLVCGGRCPMLNASNRCDIYPSRPNVCVGFPVGGPTCNELRAEAGLPAIATVSNGGPTNEV